MKPLKTFLFVGSLVYCIMAAACKKDELGTPPASTISTTDNAALRINGNLILPESDHYDSIPQDPRNPLNAAKVELGKLLFHETRL
jgi:cytochrome c peroxidase